MDFRLTDDQRELQDAARKFARAELPDLARDMEEKDYPVPHDMLLKYGELGFLGVNLPSEYGGLGLGHVEALLVLEEFAQISNARPHLADRHGAVMPRGGPTLTPSPLAHPPRSSRQARRARPRGRRRARDQLQEAEARAGCVRARRARGRVRP